MEPLFKFIIVSVLIPAVWSKSCGKQLIGPYGTNKILGGSDSKRGEWPWQAYVFTLLGGSCSGTLLNSDWVLTAAHCFPDDLAVMVAIALGSNVIKLDRYGFPVKDVEAEHLANASKVLLHKNYGKLGYDIALVKLREPVDVDSAQYINTACLPDPNYNYSSSECMMTGWGIQGYDPNDNPIDSEVLQKTETTIFDCSLLDPEFLSYPDIFVCTENLNSTACDGDSGGPLVCKVENTWHLVGVLEGGPANPVNCKENCDKYEKGCCDWKCYEGAPNVFARTAAFLEWIETILDNDGNVGTQKYPENSLIYEF